MDTIFGWLVKLLFIVILTPFFICLFVQLIVGLAWAILPWLILGAGLVGVVAGVSAALVLRRRLPLAQRPSVASGASGQHRVRRPKSSRREED